MKIDLTNIQTRYFHFDCPFCHIVTRHFTERFDSASAKAMTLLLQNPLIHLLRVIDEHENTIVPDMTLNKVTLTLIAQP